jgi:CheY-like chemotaxis protein
MYEIMGEENPILVIEDDEASAYYLEEILAENNIPVLTASSATEALDILDTNNVSLILMDIRLPDLDGYELTRQLRIQGLSVPIIAQTAFALPDDKEKAFLSGCNDYITKPLRKDDLWIMIRKYLKI